MSFLRGFNRFYTSTPGTQKLNEFMPCEHTKPYLSYAVRRQKNTLKTIVRQSFSLIIIPFFYKCYAKPHEHTKPDVFKLFDFFRLTILLDNA